MKFYNFIDLTHFLNFNDAEHQNIFIKAQTDIITHLDIISRYIFSYRFSFQFPVFERTGGSVRNCFATSVRPVSGRTSGSPPLFGRDHRFRKRWILD